MRKRTPQRAETHKISQQFGRDLDEAAYLLGQSTLEPESTTDQEDNETLVNALDVSIRVCGSLRTTTLLRVFEPESTIDRDDNEALVLRALHASIRVCSALRARLIREHKTLSSSAQTRALVRKAGPV